MPDLVRLPHARGPRTTALTRRLLLAACAAFVVLASAAGPAVAAPSTSPTGSDAPGLGIRLLEAPLALAKDPRAQNYIVDNLPPGTTITRRFQVSNNTGAQRIVSLYPGAASIQETGGFVLEDGRAQNELTSWMSVTPRTLTIPDGRAADATVRIAVPRTATETERYAVIWAETSGGTATRGGISTVSRVGIRTYLSVGPGNGPPAQFSIGQVTPGRSSSGAPQLTVQTTNTGKRALDPEGTITLTGGPGGISTGTVKGSGGSVAPGGMGNVVFGFDSALPDGPWTANISITSGTVNRTGTSSVTFPAKGMSRSSPVDQSDGGGTSWWIWVGGVALLVVVVGGGVIVFLRRRSGEVTS
ncbi:MAG: hypothetical protein NTW76_20515 [Corynebacteriales bacterium]|nr:hypothetical protein [Mycobacteriales bacterium]